MSEKTIKFYFLAIPVFIFFSCSPGVKVSVKNNSGETIKDMTVFYTGGKVKIQKLEHGGKETFYVNPDGESHLEITFKDESGHEFKRLLNVYFEKNYNGRLYVLIRKDFIIELNNRISLPY